MEAWMRTADVDLYGPNGNDGMVHHHQAELTRKETQKEDSDKFNRRVALFCAICASVVPICKLLEFLHILPK